MLLAILCLVLSIPLTAFIVGVLFSGPRYRGPRSDHFDGSRFFNPAGVKAKGGLQVLKWMINRKRGIWKEDLTENYGKHPLAHFKDGIRITYINHSTFLIQVDGLNILTDPVWSERVSPFTWLGPKRAKLPGIRFGDLPHIHLVLLSHNHYDHLDLNTMRTLFGAHHPRIVAPLGLKKFLDRHYIAGATEMDWWEEIALDGKVSIQAVPAQHFSGRGMLDRDATLWCGYVLKTTAGNVYFAADTGYNTATFKDVGKTCGPFRVSMLPIGAYKPGWFMSPIHVSPDESVKIHRDLGSAVSIAMHFGTFPLADDGCDEPVTDLRKAMQKHQLEADEFIVLKEGEFIVFE
jgi:L-ascorbate metabolism protein UlaG (beta-lactamase superfamily)